MAVYAETADVALKVGGHFHAKASTRSCGLLQDDRPSDQNAVATNSLNTGFVPQPARQLDRHRSAWNPDPFGSPPQLLAARVPACRSGATGGRFPPSLNRRIYLDIPPRRPL